MRKNILKCCLWAGLALWAWAIPMSAQADDNPIVVTNEWKTPEYLANQYINNMVVATAPFSGDKTASGSTIYNYTELYGSNTLKGSSTELEGGVFSLYGNVSGSGEIKDLTINNYGRMARIDLSKATGTIFYNKKSDNGYEEVFNPFAYTSSTDKPSGYITLNIKNGSTVTTDSIGVSASGSVTERRGEVWGTVRLGDKSQLFNMNSIRRIAGYTIAGDSTTTERIQEHYLVNDPEIDDVLSMGDSSWLFNGLEPNAEGSSTWGDDKYNLNTKASITEQLIKMGNDAKIYNAGRIGKTCSGSGCTDYVEVAIETGTGGYLENAATPYSAKNETITLHTVVPEIKATSINMGAGSTLVNDWGGEVYASGATIGTGGALTGIKMGSDSYLVNGYAPLIDEDQERTAWNTTYMFVRGNIEMGDNAWIYNVSNRDGKWDSATGAYVSSAVLGIGLATERQDLREAKIIVGNDSTIINDGGTIKSLLLSNEGGRAEGYSGAGNASSYHTYLSVGDNTKIRNTSYHFEDAEGVHRVLGSIHLERLWGAPSSVSSTWASHVKIYNTGYIRVSGMHLGDYTKIENEVLTENGMSSPGRIWAGEITDHSGSIILGNNSTITNKGRVITHKLYFGDYGKLNMVSADAVALAAPQAFNNTSYTATLVSDLTVDGLTELKMGRKSTIYTDRTLYAKGELGGGSLLYLQAPQTGEETITRTDHLFADPNWGIHQGGTFYGSLKQADDGLTDTIWIDAQSAPTSYTRLGGWEKDTESDLAIEVGTIQVDSGTLEIAGPVSGDVILNGSNTVLRMTGDALDFKGAILKSANVTNTTLHVKAGSKGYTHTADYALDVDTVYISDGGLFTLASNENVHVGEYLLGSNGTLKLKRLPTSYAGGDITRFESATETTLHLDLPTSSTIFLAPGKIDVDKLIVQTGILRVTPEHQDIASVVNLKLGQNGTLDVVGGADLRVNTIAGYNDTYGSVNIDHAKLTIAQSGTNMKNLTLSSGTLVYKGNEVSSSVFNVFNDVDVGKGSTFEARNKVQIRATATQPKALTIQKGGNLVVHNTTGEDTLKLITVNLTLKTGSNVIMEAGDTIQMMKGGDYDEGTIWVEKNARIFVKKPIPGREYLVMSTGSADHWLNTEAEIESYLKTSFLYINPVFDWRSEGGQGNLYLTMYGVNDLYTALWPVVTDENDRSMLRAMDQIHKKLSASEDFPPWLARILDSSTAEEAAGYVIEMDPDVHTNLVKSAQQLNRTMTRHLSSLLHEIHTKSNSNPYRQGMYYRSGNYGYYNYGRSGGDTYYRYRGRYYPYMPYGNEAPTYSVQSENGSVRSDNGAVWVKPFANQYEQDDIGGIAGYKLKNTGIMAGADADFDEWTWGIMGMYNQGRYKGNDSLFKADIDSYAFGLYGSYQPDEHHYFVDFYATYMNSSQDTTQRLSEGNITADYDTKTISGGLSVGYPIAFANYFAVVPAAGVDYARVDPDDFTEKSAVEGIGTKRVKNKTLQSIQSALSARLLANFQVKSVQITPEVFGKWSHEFKDTAARSSVTFIDYPEYAFKIKGKDADKQLYTLGGSLTLTADDSERLFFTYAYDFNDTVKGHTFELGYLHSF
ncbi:MAG: autotransporter outer membrane beta-barrel domain-containing protein [Alphaproteobacteria bacterium]|nr:autotransporter outer membrane beta-barrel domain-containing protein [Alphaproteobacteria bacterium]